ncbi:MAG: hypothetical protein E7310_03020 [Clostridiales bacterium]|nr:hypothetical protein [Clostridiales bacterium]
MNILYTAFNGKYNSSKILLDNIKISDENKLYLRNSFITSVKQLQKKIKLDNYDLIVSFGQLPLEQDNIRIEIVGKEQTEIYESDFDYSQLKEKLEKNNYKTEVSRDSGNYYCNNIFFNGLKYIKENNLKCKMIFIHIPFIDKIGNIEELSKLFNEK